jgi:O-antigen/teichoic acid export membrane protein
MSRASRIFAGAALGYMHMVLTTAAGLWFTPFLLRRIGQQAFGLWAVGAPILTYINLVDFGVLTLFEREVAFALGTAGGDFRKIVDLDTIVGKTLRLVLLQMPILCGAAAIAWRAMPSGWESLRMPFGLVLITLIICFPLRICHALLMGLQDLAFVGRVNIVAWGVGFVLGVVLVLIGWGLYALAISWCVGQVVINLVCYVRVGKRFTAALPKRLPRVARSEGVAKLSRGFWVVISQLASALLTGTDVVVIAALLGPAAVVPFAITDKLVNLSGNIPFHLMISAQPALSELRTSADRDRLRNACTALTHAVLLVSGFLAVIIVAVDRGFVEWWVGAPQFAGSAVVIWLAAAMLFGHWTTTTVFTLFSFGYERLISITTILNGVLTLGGTVLLTRLYGLVGAPLAATVGFIVVGLPAHLFAIARETGTTVLATLASLVPWAWRLTLLMAGAAVVAKVWVPRSFFTLAGTSIAVAAAYVALMHPLAMREPLGTYVRPRLAALRLRLASTR